MGFFLKQKSMFLVYQTVFFTPVRIYNTSKKLRIKIRDAFFRERVQTYLELVTCGGLTKGADTSNLWELRRRSPSGRRPVFYYRMLFTKSVAHFIYIEGQRISLGDYSLSPFCGKKGYLFLVFLATEFCTL